MNVFVLNTGRCGSTTFMKACQHISNFSSSHESRSGLLGDAHFNYPDNHIEVDNRLSWFLGRLDRRYGDNAIYIHLKRETEAVAKSYAGRSSPGGVIHAYKNGGMLTRFQDCHSDMSVALDYCDTVNSNIELFMKDKTQIMEFNIEDAKNDFKKFWDLINAEGNIDAALAEYDICYNNTPTSKIKQKQLPLLLRALKKLNRLVVKFPGFIKNV